MSFVHLHVHSQYSLLDGLSNPQKLVTRAKEMGMPAVALTDHGTMFGVIEFYQAAKSVGIKPIIGLEAYLSTRGMTDRDPVLDKRSHHLLLLAKNQTGYQNLLKIASAAQLEGFYYFPRIDHDFLAAHSEGLIGTTGCMSSEISRTIRERGSEAGKPLIDWYYEVFGRENFYFELQNHQIPELTAYNNELMGLGKRYNARYVATNDVHYIEPSDWRLQDIQLAVQTGSLLSDPNRFKMSVNSFYLRSGDEMGRLFAEVPEALSNTLLVAESCEVNLDTQGYHLPHFEVPEGFSVQSYLRNLCDEGLRRRYQARAEDAQVRERLEYELKIIHDMGFDAYFLIVWDLCRYAREQGIWYNARGSAEGSVVAYALGITLIEPLEHDLIFERFLNPGRITMPDIDLDFQDDLRPQVMQYCAERYGTDKVASIITFGTMGSRGAVRDVGRVMDIPLSEVDRVTKLIPGGPTRPNGIREALDNVPELKALYDSAEYLRDLIDTASQMEGVIRNAGTHAAGVVISDVPITEYLPLHRPTGGSEDSPIKAVSQFEMSVVEALGMLKVDFLGLATLTIMQRACDLIFERHGIRYTLDTIPIDDPATYQFLAEGHTAGVFQLEGTGMTRFLVQMRPQSLDNVIAMVALYRPGPLEFIPDYIQRMHGETPVVYRHPTLEPIFSETYGIPVYQEQIMRAAVDLAGYTMSESDDLRKAIAKKQKEKLEKHREKFIQGAVGNGMQSDIAAKIFEDWEEFARYGFNKSHAADYGTIAVQTAFLKTHYTVEYMTALLSVTKSDTAKVALYAADCRSMGVAVLPPDINSSAWDFSVVDLQPGSVEQEECEAANCSSAIRFGLGAVKNVGQGPVDLIFEARQAGGPFTSISEFATRVDLRAVGKRSLESLIKVGALDCLGPRKGLLEVMDSVIALSSSHFRAAQAGQLSFFGDSVQSEISLPFAPSLDNREQLEWERELIGLYVSDHPLSPYLQLIQEKTTHASDNLAEARDRAQVRVAGFVAKFRTIQTKSGKMMAFVTLEDLQGSVELVVFPSVWERFQHLVTMEAVLLAEGKADAASGETKVLVDTLSALDLDEAANFGFGASVNPAEILALVEGEEIVYTPNPEALREAKGNGNGIKVPPNGNKPPAEPQAAAPKANGAAAPRQASEPPEEPPDWHLHFSSEGAPGDENEPALNSGNGTLPALEAGYVEAAVPRIQPEEPAPVPEVFPLHEAPVEQAEDVEEKMHALPLEAVPYLVGALLRPEPSSEPRMLKVILRASGDKDRDIRRLKLIHGKICSFPGEDRFSFLIFEGSSQYLLEFPNDTIGICPALLQELYRFVSESNVRVEAIRIQ